MMVTGIGRLTGDPELRYTPGGMCICSFSVAENKRQKNKEDKVNYFECTAFSKTAEIAKQYLNKGDRIYIEGNLVQDRWKDKNTNQNRSAIKININQIEFLTPKSDPTDHRHYEPATSQQPQQQQQGDYYAAKQGDPSSFDDECPF